MSTGWAKYRDNHAAAVAARAHNGIKNPSVVFSVDRFVLGTRVPVGGFADRIKGAAFAFLCAVATGRNYFIDWRTPSPLTNSFMPSDIDWRVDEALVAARESGASCDWVDSGFSEEVKLAIRSGSIEERLFRHSDVATVWMNLWRPDLFANSPYAERLSALGLSPDDPVQTFHEIFTRLMRFSPVAEQASRVRDFMSFRARHGRVIGVQFRTGGDGGWEDPIMDAGNNVARIAQAAINVGGGSSSSFGYFVTTDSVRARQELLRLLSPTADVFTFGIDPMHVDRSHDIAAIRLADFVPAEFHVLGLCDRIVIGNGGFGLTAGWAANKQAVHYTTAAP